MKLKLNDGSVVETKNKFVIEQMLKHGAKEVEDKPKKKTSKVAE